MLSVVDRWAIGVPCMLMMWWVTPSHVIDADVVSTSRTVLLSCLKFNSIVLTFLSIGSGMSTHEVSRHALMLMRYCLSSVGKDVV
jgi:hypothetical protein